MFPKKKIRHDELSKRTDSIGLAGVELKGSSVFSSLSADGRYVAFTSIADTLVQGDTNVQDDVFVSDRLLNASLHADLQIAVAYQPASVKSGENAQYVFTITNKGPDNAISVTLINIISGGSVKSVTPSEGGHCNIAAVSVCCLPQLAAGASATVTSIVKTKESWLTQRLTVNSAPAESVIANKRITVSTSVTP